MAATKAIRTLKQIGEISLGISIAIHNNFFSKKMDKPSEIEMILLAAADIGATQQINEISKEMGLTLFQGSIQGVYENTRNQVVTQNHILFSLRQDAAKFEHFMKNKVYGVAEQQERANYLQQIQAQELVSQETQFDLIMLVRREYAANKDDLHQLKDQLAILYSGLTSRIDDAEEAVQTALQGVSENTYDISNLREGADETKALVNTNTSDIKSIKEDAGQTKTSVGALEEGADETKALVNTNTSAIKSIQDQISGSLEQQFKKHRNQVDGCCTEIAMLQNRMDNERKLCKQSKNIEETQNQNKVEQAFATFELVQRDQFQKEQEHESAIGSAQENLARDVLEAKRNKEEKMKQAEADYERDVCAAKAKASSFINASQESCELAVVKTKDAAVVKEQKIQISNEYCKNNLANIDQHCEAEVKSSEKKINMAAATLKKTQKSWTTILNDAIFAAPENEETLNKYPKNLVKNGGAVDEDW